MNLAIVTTLCEPIDLTRAYVHYHLNRGVDRMYLFFDDPNDPAVEEVGAYDQVWVQRCDEAYWRKSPDGERDPNITFRQRVNLQVAVERVREEGFSWLAHIDADELMHFEGALPDLLQRFRRKIVRMRLCEAVAEEMSPSFRFAPTLFRVRPPRPYYRMRVRLARLLGVKNCIFRGNYFRGHEWSKVLVRTDLKFQEFRVHDIDGAEEPREEQSGALKLLHFDCVGFERWKWKWDRFVTGERMGNIGRNRTQQIEEIVRARERGEGAMEQLYRRFYFISEPEQRRLRMLGLLKRIEIERAAFCAPEAVGLQR